MFNEFCELCAWSEPKSAAAVHQAECLGRNEELPTLENDVKSGFVDLLAPGAVWSLPSGGFLHSECTLQAYSFHTVKSTNILHWT